MHLEYTTTARTFADLDSRAPLVVDTTFDDINLHVDSR